MHHALRRRQFLSLGSTIVLAPACRRPPAPASEWKWQRLPDLPLGLGGQFAGVHNGALIVAGGSCFPVSKWEGGAKQWISHMFVLEDAQPIWKRFQLPRPLAYGGSVSHARGLLLIGGGDAHENLASCLWLRWNGSSVDIEPAAPLPLPLANCAAAELNGRAYVFGGQQSPTSTSAERGLYSIDLDNPGAAWQTELPLPGPARILPSVAAADALFVAGGADLHAGANGNAARTYLPDAWQFTPGTGWRALPELPAPSCAAPAFGLAGEFFVLGGSDGVLAARENELRDAHPGFSRSVYAYQARRGAWRTAAQLPFSLVTTTATVWNGLLAIPGGEDRPAHRSAAVHLLDLRAGRL
jgi:N-acetylneuraminate epimerase